MVARSTETSHKAMSEFNGLGKDSEKTRRESFKIWGLVRGLYKKFMVVSSTQTCLQAMLYQWLTTACTAELFGKDSEFSGAT